MGQERPNDANIEAPRVSKRVIDTISKLFDTIPKGHWHYFCICKTSTLSGSPIDNWLNWLYLVIDFSSFGKHGAHNSLANNKVLQMYFYVWAPEGSRILRFHWLTVTDCTSNVFLLVLKEVQPSVWKHGGMIDLEFSNNETTEVIDFNISNMLKSILFPCVRDRFPHDSTQRMAVERIDFRFQINSNACSWQEMTQTQFPEQSVFAYLANAKVWWWWRRGGLKVQIDPIEVGVCRGSLSHRPVMTTAICIFSNMHPAP